MRYAFEFDASPAGRAVLRALGLRPDTSWVEVADGRFTARFGHWKITTPIDNVAEAHVDGPYRELRAIGVRLSLKDHGLTFGSTARRGVCIHFREPLKSATTLPFRHPNLTVTVDRPDDLVAELRAGAGLPADRTA